MRGSRPFPAGRFSSDSIGDRRRDIPTGMMTVAPRFDRRTGMKPPTGSDTVFERSVGPLDLMTSPAILDALGQDIRYAVRQLGGDRGFTTIAVLTLGLGIGSATVMYSVLHNVLLEPFPYAGSARLVDVVVRDAERPGDIFRGALPAAEFLDFQEGSDAFEDVIGTVGDD